MCSILKNQAFKIVVCLTALVLFYSSLVNAQLCNGNLGDPILSVTFSGRSPLPVNKTTFKYQGGCPSPGNYTIDNFLIGCGDRTWFSLIGDHTADFHGNYMAVNAESTPGIVYLDTIAGLCSNVTYQFSAWLMNVMRIYTCNGTALLPDIDFQVEGLDHSILAHYNTGSLGITSDKVWKQYGLSFLMPPGVSSVIVSIRINAQTGCGSAFAIDDISFNVCGPPVNVTINGTDNTAIEVCADYTESYQLEATYGSGFINPAFQWQSSLDTGLTFANIPGANNTTYSMPYRNSGVIIYRFLIAETQNINSPKCRITSKPIYTEIHPVPAHKPSRNLMGCLGQNLVLPFPDELAQTVEWIGPNGYISDKPVSVIPNLSNQYIGLYSLMQVFPYGCTSLDSFNVLGYPGTKITLPATYSVCEGKDTMLMASGDGTFFWMPADNLSDNTISNPILTPQDSTQYKVTLTNSFGCKDSGIIKINVYRNPFADAGKDISILKGDTAILSGNLRGTQVDFNWSPNVFIDNNTTLNPKVFPEQDIIYTLSVTSTVGCGIATSSVVLKVFDDIYIPNAFTPNGDGRNDKFKIYLPYGYKVIKYFIYNRWGNIVYKGFYGDDGWDGMVNNIPAPAGNFIYYLEMLSPSGKKINKKGSLILIR